MTLIISICSEKGGVGKSTKTTLLAMAAAMAGHRVTVVDLDPRATATTILDVAPTPGYSTDAILAAEDPTGWGEQLALRSPWHPQLRVIPAERSLGNREKAPADHAEHRLGMALVGLHSDVVITDVPPRPGGILALTALAVPGVHVLYAATPDQDGLDGVAHAWTTAQKAKQFTNPSLATLGIALTRIDNRTAESRRVSNEFASIYGEHLILGQLPERVVVREARAASEWVGLYSHDVRDAAAALWDTVYTRSTKGDTV